MPDALGPAPRIVVGTFDAVQAMPRRNIVVIAPRLDDAVLDCGDHIRSWLDGENRTTAWSRRQRTERLVMANGRHLPFENESFDVGVDMRKGSPTLGP